MVYNKAILWYNSIVMKKQENTVVRIKPAYKKGDFVVFKFTKDKGNREGEIVKVTSPKDGKMPYYDIMTGKEICCHVLEKEILCTKNGTQEKV